MTKARLTLALDAMGGDHAPLSVIDGAARVLKKNSNINFILCGDENKIQPLLNKHPKLLKHTVIEHTTDFVAPTTKPSVALRKGKNSSMRLAINAVAEGRAQAVISAGNTGALMAMSKIVLRPLPGVTRPAIASTMPTIRKGRDVVLLDLGANLECTAQNLVEFAILGSTYARLICGAKVPRIGILNVGSEDMKGHDHLKEAADILSATLTNAEYVGFVEGTDIAQGDLDVIVTDGFTGNVALKTIEGTAKMMATMIKDAIWTTPISYLGLPFMYFALRKLKKRIDPRLYNGGMFMGLGGLCMKSHGGADDIGFANAIEAAYQLADLDFNENVKRDLAGLEMK